jgi:hypothetical protein
MKNNGSEFREVTLEIRPPPHSWVMDLISDYSVRVEILDCKPVGKDKVNEIFEIKCNPKDLNMIKEKIMNSEYIDKSEIFITDSGKGLLYGVIKTSHCNVCKLFSDSSECFLGSAVYDIERNRVKWRLIAHTAILEKIIDRLKKNGIEINVESITEIKMNSKSTELTFNQDKILKLALKLGYFDYPRKITLQELSKIIKRSPSTIVEALRASMKKVVTLYYKKKEEESKFNK